MAERPTLKLTRAQLHAAHGDPSHHHIVLAGPGSGKTRVLTERIAWLIQKDHIRAPSILATTFTTKAAEEIRARATALAGPQAAHIAIGTFHAHGLRIMREHPRECPLRPRFRVLDSADQLRLIRPLVRKHPTVHDALQLRDYIVSLKERGIRAPAAPEHDADLSDPPTLATLRPLYTRYETLCATRNAADFTELLLAPLEMLRTHSTLRDHYAARLRHILLDEAQDTNPLQHRLVDQLRGPHTRLFIVGDDDQSIYRWRGADPAYMSRLAATLHPNTLHRLDKNHRSTGSIVEASASLVSHNRNRLTKSIHTDHPLGPELRTVAAQTPQDEALHIARQLHQWLLVSRPTIAVLYRTNAQSQPIEQALSRLSIPYRIRGTHSFFAREEIAATLAWMHCVAASDDDPHFARTLIHPPKPGLSHHTVRALARHAKDHALSLEAFARNQCVRPASSTDPSLPSLASHLESLDLVRARLAQLSLGLFLSFLLTESGLARHYDTLNTERAREQRDNLEALAAAAAALERQHPHQSPHDILTGFLDHASASPDTDTTDHHHAPVELMTAHASKGLEFDRVWVAGLDEGTFPHAKSFTDPENVEQERRLCYVAMTRARHHLVLSYPRERQTTVKTTTRRPSRFLREITQPARPTVAIAIDPHTRVRPNDRVHNARFGPGTIVTIDPEGTPSRLTVRFDRDPKPRTLIADHAKLTKL